MSAISPINSSYSNAPAQSTQRTPEASELKGVADKDGDVDGRGAKAVSAPAPTVNMSGQKLGQVINDAA